MDPAPAQLATTLLTTATPTAAPPGSGATHYRVGEQIGPFLLLEEIGAGGMGVVYLAEQTEPLQRRVALKLMSPNFVDAYAEAMFLVERQALARLEHPCVARVYEAGSTDNGALYFAMEWVDGERIDRYCRSRQLGHEAILRLAIDICRGVQHAHTRGVIHRDLKPANILVANVDGTPLPRIIDFGIAGAPGVGSERTLGTLGYMSPEQAQAGAIIDQRADVYALGVVILELLTASAGLDNRSWWNLDAASRERMLLTAADHSPERRRLVASLPRDLRAIVARALRPDREQRYSGAEALAADLQCYLDGFPVSARTRTRGYVLRRFVARHRFPVVLVAAIAITIVGLLLNAIGARQQAEREALKAAMTAQFLQSVLAGVEPRKAQELDRTLMRLVLDGAAARVDTELAAEPAVRAEVARTIADTYVALGESKRALGLIEPVHAELLRSEGAAAPGTLDAERTLLAALRQDGQIDRARALAAGLYAKERVRFGATDARTLGTAALLVGFMHEAGELTEARDFGEARLRELAPDSDADASAALLIELAQAYSRLGDHDHALGLTQRAVDLRESVHGADDLQAIGARTEIGALHFQAGRYAEALALWRALLPRYERTYGPEHLETLSVRGNIASALTMTGAPAEAAAIFAELVDIRRRVQGADHPETLIAIGNHASALYRSANYAAAEDAFRQYIVVCDRLYQPAHPSCAERRVGLGKSLREQGRYAEAETALLQAYNLKGQIEGRQFGGPEKVASELAQLYQRWGRTDQARTWAERADPAAAAVAPQLPALDRP